MRVLIVAEGDSWGGIETHLMTLLPHCLDNPAVDITCLLFHHGALSESLLKIGIKVTVIQKKRLVAGFLNIRAFLKHNRFDIIHMHSLVAAFSIIVCSLGIRRPYLIWTLHGKAEKVAGIRWIKDRISRNLVYPIMKMSETTRFICVSDEIVDWLVHQHHVPATKMVVIKNGFRAFSIDLDTDKLKQQLKLPADNALIAMVGRLVEVKGHIYVLKTIESMLRNGHDKIRLLLIGDGPLRSWLEDYCSRAGLTKHVLFLGTRSDARELVALSDIFVMASLHEGLPYSLLEAMFLEKPIIASAVGGIPEAIKHKHNGILVESKDVSGIAAALVYLIKDKEFGKLIGKNARTTVLQKFSSLTMANRTVNLYRTVLYNN